MIIILNMLKKEVSEAFLGLSRRLSDNLDQFYFIT